MDDNIQRKKDNIQRKKVIDKAGWPIQLKIDQTYTCSINAELPMDFSMNRGPVAGALTGRRQDFVIFINLSCHWSGNHRF